MELSGEVNSEASSREELAIGHEDFPEGRTYPLNSKRLLSGQLQALAKILGLPGGASMEETRQLIEGKLIELGHEPRNVQVIVKEDEQIFLVDDEGIITEGIITTKHVSNDSMMLLQGHVSETEQHVSIVQDYVNNDDTLSLSHRDDIVSLRSALCEAHRQNESLALRLHEQQSTVTQLESEVGEAKEIIPRLEDELWKEKAKTKRFWRQQCEQLLLHETTLEERDTEIVRLRKKLAGDDRCSREMSVHLTPTPATEGVGWHNELKVTTQAPPQHPRRGNTLSVDSFSGSTSSPPEIILHPRDLSVPPSSTEVGLQNKLRAATQVVSSQQQSRRGKALPIDCFSGNNSEITFDDWLPSLERVAKWNGWSSEDILIQLAGHLRGRALQEWLLLSEEDRSTWDSATTALRGKLEVRSKVLATQDFRHIRQKERESVADFIYCMEKEFHIAYKNDTLSRDTREAFVTDG